MARQLAICQDKDTVTEFYTDVANAWLTNRIYRTKVQEITITTEEGKI